MCNQHNYWAKKWKAIELLQWEMFSSFRFCQIFFKRPFRTKYEVPNILFVYADWIFLTQKMSYFIEHIELIQIFFFKMNIQQFLSGLSGCSDGRSCCDYFQFSFIFCDVKHFAKWTFCSRRLTYFARNRQNRKILFWSRETVSLIFPGFFTKFCQKKLWTVIFKVSKNYTKKSTKFNF